MSQLENGECFAIVRRTLLPAAKVPIYSAGDLLKVVNVGERAQFACLPNPARDLAADFGLCDQLGAMLEFQAEPFADVAIVGATSELNRNATIETLAIAGFGVDEILVSIPFSGIE